MIHVSRRSAILGAGCLLGCAGAAHASLVRQPTCSAAAPAVSLSAEEQERHAIFMLLAILIAAAGCVRLLLTIARRLVADRKSVV